MSKTYLWVAAIALATTLSLPASRANLGEEESDKTVSAEFQEGKKAIAAQDWKTAIAALNKAVAAEPKNADAYNYLGYALRKDGDVEHALEAYGQALTLNPRHKAAHEYLGEAYLMLGDLARAEKQLDELRKLCTPIPCEEYKDLNKAIAAHKKARQ